MKNSLLPALVPGTTIPKTEAIARLTRQLATVQAGLDAAKAQLKTAVTGKYALNFQVNALKKELHRAKAQIARLQKEPRAEVVWSDRKGA